MDHLYSFLNELTSRTSSAHDRTTWPTKSQFTSLHKTTQMNQVVDLKDPMFWICCGMILFNPLFWNTVARMEYRTHFLTKAFGGAKQGTYFLAVVIFSLGIIRDAIYKSALTNQPSSTLLSSPIIQLAGVALFVGGQVLVLTSIWALGITGTYLGDYFGILMSSRVITFPFNIMSDPMYNGSTMCFAGTAIWYKKPAGLVLTVLVYVVYQIALMFEGPFTAKIYSSAAAANKKSTTSSSSNTKKSLNTPHLSSPSSPSSNTSKQNPTSSSSSTTSYAAAAAHAPSSSGLPSTDPHPVPEVKSAHDENAGIDSDGGLGSGSAMASPRTTTKRVTRSRSKAKLVED